MFQKIIKIYYYLLCYILLNDILNIPTTITVNWKPFLIDLL